MAFLRQAGRLKTLPRQGWVDREIPAPESVADHLYRTALMAWVLGEQAGLDTNRLLKLVLIHDLPEALAGDATPYDPLVEQGMERSAAALRWRELLDQDAIEDAKLKKDQRETDALLELSALLPATLNAELRELWADYVERRSPEAQFAAQVDKLEAFLQAIEYEAAGHAADLENFFQNADVELTHPLLRELLATLQSDAQG
ncbi:MAG TPA: HD domain-containing protein [Chloroflexota bacterium]